MTQTYDQFVDRASTLLVASGAQRLLESFPAGAGPAWATGWDSVLLSDGPGSRAIYAFTQVRDVASLQNRVNELARGIASTGMPAHGAVQLTAVAVLSPTARASRGEVGRIAPTTFFPGLRPATWTVDLLGGDVRTGIFKGGEERALLLSALKDIREGEVLDAAGVSESQNRYLRQQQAFYSLMQGRQPIVTYGLIAVNVILFLLLYSRGGPGNETALRDMGALSPILVQHGQWWRLCTSMFLHAGITHILFNMTSLFAVGVLAERLYGSARFLAIYLGAGLIGSLSSFGYAVASGQTDVLGVGASGAIFGVAGALLTVRFQPSDVIPRRLRSRVTNQIAPLVLFSLIFAFLTPHVDNAAHVGGLIGGMVLSFVFPLVKESRERTSVT